MSDEIKDGFYWIVGTDRQRAIDLAHRENGHWYLFGVEDQVDGLNPTIIAPCDPVTEDGDSWRKLAEELLKREGYNAGRETRFRRAVALRRAADPDYQPSAAQARSMQEGHP